MRRLSRWTLNTLTALSLLLSVAMAVLWARSYHRADWFERASAESYWGVSSNAGRIQWTTFDARSSQPGCWPYNHQLGISYATAAPTATAYPSIIGGRQFALLSPDDQGAVVTSSPTGLLRDVRALVAPHWAVVLVLGSLPAYRLARRRPSIAGFCVACCYDLTGNVSGVCPECGAATAKPVV